MAAFVRNTLLASRLNLGRWVCGSTVNDKLPTAYQIWNMNKIISTKNADKYTRSADKYRSVTVNNNTAGWFQSDDVRLINLNPRFPEQPISNWLNPVDGDDQG